MEFEEEVSPEGLRPPRGGRKPKYDWSQLRPGPYPAVFTDKEEYQRAVHSVRHWAKKHGVEVKTMECKDGKFRIWRIK